MLTPENIYVILYSLPVYQLLFYTVQLISLKRSNPARKYLGLMLFTMTVFLILNAIYHLGYEAQMKWLYYFFVPVLLSLLPVTYLYFVSLARGNREVDSRTRLILFLPPIVVFILNLVVYRALPAPEKLLFFQNGFQMPEGPSGAIGSVVSLHVSGIAALLAVQMILAVAGIYKVLRREADVMHRQPGHLAFLQFPWIAVIFGCVLLFLIAGSLLNLFGPARGMGPAVAFNVAMLICGGLTGFFGMKQDSLMDQVSKVSEKAAQPEDHQGREEQPMAEAGDPSRLPSFITDAEAKKIIRDLDIIMKRDKPFLNPKFSLYDLCQLMNVNRRKLTYVINEVMQKNFYGVVNDYRIEESIRLLNKKEGNDYKMDSIAEMVGFNSKSSFYACFKRYTGVTPTEFRMNKPD